MIAVTGATGHLGQLVIQELLKYGIKPSDIVALVRNPEKAKDYKTKGIEVRIADYDKPESLMQSLSGIKKLLLISGSEVGKRIEQHKAIIMAARENKVSYIAYTSILAADKSPLALAKEHFETEKMIEASEIPFTFLRNGWYTENYLMSIPNAIESGEMFGCAGEAKFSAASRSDYAQAAAKVMATEGHLRKIYELAGDETFTLNELAKVVGDISGKSVKYINLSEKDYSQLLVKVGLPEAFAGMLAETETLSQKGWLEDNSHTLSKLIGKKTINLHEAVKSVVNK